MAALTEQFKINYEKAKSKSGAVFQGQKYRITILSELLIRFEYNAKGNFENRPTEFAINRDFEIPPMGVTQDNKFLVITTKYFKLEYTKEKPFAGSAIAKDSNLRVMLLGTDKIWYFRHPEARNFLGTTSNLNDKITKDSLNRGLYSTDGFVSVDDSDSLILEPDGLLKRDELKSIDIYLFIYKKDFGLCLKDYFELTGKPALIRRSALGIWWYKDYDYNYQDIKELIGKFNRHEVPISNLILNNSWCQKYNTKKTGFSFNKELFANPFELTNYAHERGINIGLEFDPSEGINPGEPLYDEILEELKLTEKINIPFNMFDPATVGVYLNKILPSLNNLGVDFLFIKNDSRDYESIRALNYYTFNYYLHNIQKRGLILASNGLKVSHRYPAYYSGETLVSWDTLKYLPYFNSRSSNIGVSWWSHDIGGYKGGIEDPELYMRYVQLGTFSPIFRFASTSGRYYKRMPWQWDAKTSQISTYYSQLRQRFIPYLYNEGYKYYKTGLPLIQPLYYKYPHITDEPLYKNEYFFGTELFVAPITIPKDLVMNRVVHRIFIPNGMWYDFKTGKKFPGGKRYITFFKDEDYPVFAKSGSIIPLANLEKNKNSCQPPKNMEIHVFPGLSNTYKLYEDDGESSLYKEGYYIITNIDYNYQANNYTLIIRPIEGKSGIIPEKRNYKIRFRNTKEANDVIVYIGDSKVNSTHYAEDADFIVEVNGVPTVKQLTINCKGQDIEIDAVRLINEDIDSIISDLQIETSLKDKIAEIIFSHEEIKKKRIKIRKLRKEGLDKLFIRMFLKLLEYVAEI